MSLLILTLFWVSAYGWLLGFYWPKAWVIFKDILHKNRIGQELGKTFSNVALAVFLATGLALGGVIMGANSLIVGAIQLAQQRPTIFHESGTQLALGALPIVVLSIIPHVPFLIMMKVLQDD